MATPAPARFAQLPKHAVNEPGILSSAYCQFHGYSLRNQLLALCQCIARGIQPGPIPRSNVGRNRGDSSVVVKRPSRCVGQSRSSAPRLLTMAPKRRVVLRKK